LSSEVPVVLTIAGSDSSAGAGVQADLKTFSALAVYGLTAVTCVVAETPGRVVRIHDVGPAIVRAQLDVLFESFPIKAIKTGLLCSRDIVATVAQRLSRRTGDSPLVVDPVLVATSGDALLHADAIEIYQNELFPQAALVTPNLEEAGRLVGEPVTDLDLMRAAGELLVKRYGVPFLLKGGHLGRECATDLLFYQGQVREFSAPFESGVATHGTGCTYSAAIAAYLAYGVALEEAVRRAKEFVSATIRQHFAWRTSSGAALHALNHSPNKSES